MFVWRWAHASVGSDRSSSGSRIPSWRRRLAVLVVGVAMSTLFIPWPAFFLQVAPSVNQGYRTMMVALVGESRFDSWNPATLAGHGSLAERFYAIDGAVRMALALLSGAEGGCK